MPATSDIATWPAFLDAPPELTRRSTADGWRQFREVAIPLHREDIFSRWWQANSGPMVRLGWWPNNFNGKTSIQQWLTMEGRLTPIGLESLNSTMGALEKPDFKTMEYTLDTKIACLSREVQMRRRVYLRQVNEGRMDAATAEREIGVMAAILADYKAQQDAAQPSLFPTLPEPGPMPLDQLAKCQCGTGSTGWVEIKCCSVCGLPHKNETLPWTRTTRTQPHPEPESQP